MQAIRNIADTYRAVVIEDACHALGALYHDGGMVKLRVLGHDRLFVHPVKIIAAGEGGMITTNNERLFRSCFE
jgi:dTDP-4-amino-4,6-dideoxygalactose transaminase